MRIILDENLPVPLRHRFPGNEVVTVTWMGWAGITNGRLLTLAEAHSFDVFITADQSLQFQQNISKRHIAVIVLVAEDNSLETLEPLLPAIYDTLETIQAGEVVRV